MRLTFQDKNAEAHFEHYFSSKVLGTAWLVISVMMLVWVTRLAVTLSQCAPPNSLGCYAIGGTCTSMAVVHAFGLVCSYLRIGWGLMERHKVQLMLIDLTACMVLVLICGGHQSFPIVFNPITVCLLHGWMIPFIGCRLITDLVLHFLNVVVLVILLVDTSFREDALPWQSVFVTVILSSVLPLFVNLLHEARYRVRFMHEQQQQFRAGALWSAVHQFVAYRETHYA